MGLSIGIVGLPNVGKSTLFNALVQAKAALAANYPFATVDPNVGIVEVPDSRIKKLQEIDHPEKTIPAITEFHDIAGLVKGASTGEGLGNQFLAHIRECDAIAQVVRAFEDENVIHVHGKVDPANDIGVIHTELLLADMQTMEKRLGKARNDARSGKPEAQKALAVLEKMANHMGAGGLACELGMTDEEKEITRDLHLLTEKPFLYIANVHESAWKDFKPEEAKKAWGLPQSAAVIPICAKFEEELIGMSPEDQKPFLEEIGMGESGLNTLVKKAYETLNLMTYFTSGPKEVHAWTIHRGITAPKAAGVIHTDFEKGFIRAEVISFDDYASCGGEQGAREKGKLRLEGKEYTVQDGDVMHFRFAN